MVESTLGWVFQIYPDESLSPTLRVGSVLVWNDARAAGKRDGQRVLFLRTGPARPVWWGFGRVLPQEERWRVLGIRTVCEGIYHPALRAVPTEMESPLMAAGGTARPGSYDWDNRALGATLGLARYQERTPYLEIGARDLRLTERDLRHLKRLQPGLDAFSLT
jgi:hypothetical protein